MDEVGVFTFCMDMVAQVTCCDTLEYKFCSGNPKDSLLINILTWL